MDKECQIKDDEEILETAGASSDEDGDLDYFKSLAEKA